MKAPNLPCPERLCEEHRAFIRQIVNACFPRYRGDDDFFQEAWIGVWEAWRDFDESRGVQFNTFAATVIKRRCYDEIRRRNRMKNRPIDSLYSFIPNTTITYMDTLADQTDGIGEMDTHFLLEAIKNSGLTEQQLNVMDGRINGQTLEEISQCAGISLAKVSQNISAIKKVFKVFQNL